MLLAAAVLAAVTVQMPAQLQFDELPRKGLPAPYGISFSRTNSVALGDVDGDGDLDMVTGNGSAFGQQNGLYLNDGAGTFDTVTASHMPGDSDITHAVVLGDVDGDGDLDLVIGNVGQFGAPNRLYLNDGAGTFNDVTATQMPVDHGNTFSICLGDVDGDGDLDMVVANGGYYVEYRQNRLFLNNGTGTFSAAPASHMPPGDDITLSVALGDVDGDGDLDVMFGNAHDSYYYSNPQNRLYLNDGAGTFLDASAGQMPADSGSTRAINLGDVDGDGDLDAVIGGSGLYLNNGSGTFNDVTATQMPVGGSFDTSVALGDVDGDGDLDMLTGQMPTYASPGQNRLYLNDGTGIFLDDTGNRMPLDDDSTSSVALGDVDGDGDLDMVIGSVLEPNRLYFNLQRQLHAPTAPQLGQPYSLDAYMRHGTSTVANFALPYLSTAPASIAVPPFGTLRIDLAMAAPFAPLMVLQPAGVGGTSLIVPNQPNLVGQSIYSQAMLIGFPFDLRLSNVVADVIH